MRRTKADTTVWGATRAYRADCLADLDGARAAHGLGRPGRDRVQLRGMRTQTFVDLPFRHHRPEGGRELTSLHQGEALGRASWYMGYRPSYLTMRALYRARREPAALAMLWGYFAAAARRDRGARTRTRPSAARAPAARRHAAPRRPEVLEREASPRQRTRSERVAAFERNPPTAAVIRSR